MSETFDTLIRRKRQTIQKSRGGVISEPAPWFESSPFADVVLDGVRRKFQAQQRPTLRGTRALDRRPTFVDLVYGTAAGVDVVQKSEHDDWTGGADLDASVAEFLEFLDST